MRQVHGGLEALRQLVLQVLWLLSTGRDAPGGYGTVRGYHLGELQRQQSSHGDQHGPAPSLLYMNVSATILYMNPDYTGT